MAIDETDEPDTSHITDPDYKIAYITEHKKRKEGILPRRPEDETEALSISNDDITDGVVNELSMYPDFLKTITKEDQKKLTGALIGRLMQIRNEFAIKNFKEHQKISLLQICFVTRGFGNKTTRKTIKKLGEYLESSHPKEFSAEKLLMLRAERKKHERSEPLRTKRTREELAEERRKANGTTPKKKKAKK